MAGFFLKKFVEFWNFTEQETTKKNQKTICRISEKQSNFS